MSDPKEIWLQPACEACYGYEGRLWCEDNVWNTCEGCEVPSVKYVIATEVERLREENERLRQALVVVKESWESLPAGNHGWRTIEQWLANPMKPAMDNLRSELAKTAKEGE